MSGGWALEIAGEHRFSAPREEVWGALLDPRAVQAALPGCDRVESLDGGTYRVSMVVGIVALRGTYTGTVRVTDPRRPDSYRLAIAGAGSTGSLQADAVLTLTSDGAATRVAYSGDLKAQGAIARLGPRVLGGTAKLMIGQFMKAMEGQLARRAP